jgi:hypothetical protein
MHTQSSKVTLLPRRSAGVQPPSMGRSSADIAWMRRALVPVAANDNNPARSGGR